VYHVVAFIVWVQAMHKLTVQLVSHTLVMCPFSFLQKMARDKTLGAAFWDEHKRKFHEARERLDITKRL